MVAAVAVLVLVVGGGLFAVLSSQGPKVALVYDGVDKAPARRLILDGWEKPNGNFDFGRHSRPTHRSSRGNEGSCRGRL